MSNNIVTHHFNSSKKERNKNCHHNSFLLWFTGLFGSAKSTIANKLEMYLYKKDIHTYILDGDNIRKGINKALTFSPQDRTENIRRVAEIANLFIDAGVVVLATFISPYRKDRENIKKIVIDNNFIEVYVNTSIEEREKRYIKGLYKKNTRGRN